MNKSGQLGIENTEDQGDTAGSMGESLSKVTLGLKIAFPPVTSVDVDATGVEGGGDGDLSTVRADHHERFAYTK